MAKKKKADTEEVAPKKKSLQSLETSNHPEFVRMMHQMGFNAADWDKFKVELANEIRSARNNSVPYLTPIKLAAKTGVPRVCIHMYENGDRKPQLFNLFMIAKACGKKLKITIE